MLVKKEFFNIKCDCCESMLDDECWYPGTEECAYILSESGWRVLGGRHYCPDCWSVDDDDNIVTNDGRKFDNDGNEIKED